MDLADRVGVTRQPIIAIEQGKYPEAVVDLPSGSRAVRARAASKDERPRLWAKWAEYDGTDLDGYAARRSRETAVVILSPRP